MKCHSKEWMKEDVSLEDGVLPPQGPMAQQNSPPLTVLARTHSPLLVTSHWKVSSQSGYANKSQVLLAKKQVMVAILMQYVSMCEHEELTAESFICKTHPIGCSGYTHFQALQQRDSPPLEPVSCMYQTNKP
jgi:hypothetical protein